MASRASPRSPPRTELTAVLHPHVAGYIEFRDEIDRALEVLDPDLVKLCIDTGHSAYAGIDPAQLLRDHAARVAHIHLKDIDGAGTTR